MTHSREYDATALIAIPKKLETSQESTSYLINNRPDLFTTLRETEGVDVHVTRGLENLDLENGSVTGLVRPEYDRTDPKTVELTSLPDMALSSFGVFRSTYGRPKLVDPFVEALNPSNVRNLARDKHETATSILHPLGLYRDSVLLLPETPFTSQPDIDFSPNLIMKPNGGFASRDIHGGTPAEVAAIIRAGITEPTLVEERLDFSHPIPGIIGRTPRDQARLAEANKKGVNKELRMYSFGEMSWNPVARIAEEGSLRLTGDEWVYIDEDTVPRDALLAASIVKNAIDEKTDTIDTLLAIDLVYVTSASRPEPHWEVMEVNAEPYVMRPENNGAIGRKHQQLLAHQMARIARNSKA